MREEERQPCIRIREIERSCERECYVLGDRKQERAMRMRTRHGRQDEMEGRDVVSKGESRSGLDYRKDDLTSGISGNFADAEEGVPSLPSNVD